MNALWVTPQELVHCHQLDSCTIMIEDSLRVEHVRDILRAKTGDEIRLCLINYGLAQAQIMEMLPGKMMLKTSAPLTQKPQPAPVAKHAFIGLSRPQTIKKVLEYGTTMGVTDFHFVPAALSEKSYASAKIWEEAQLNLHLHLGLSQSNHFVHLPKVEVLQTWKQIPLRLETINQRFLLSWKSAMGESRAQGPMAVAIGPERGWTDAEEELWRTIGFLDFNLGPSVLRVECALVSALTKLN